MTSHLYFGHLIWCLEFLMSSQMLMHTIAHECFANTARESAPKFDSGRKQNPLLHQNSCPIIQTGALHTENPFA